MFSLRTNTTLKTEGIAFDETHLYSERYLLKLRNFGERSINEVTAVEQEKGYFRLQVTQPAVNLDDLEDLYQSHPDPEGWSLRIHHLGGSLLSPSVDVLTALMTFYLKRDCLIFFTGIVGGKGYHHHAVILQSNVPLSADPSLTGQVRHLESVLPYIQQAYQDLKIPRPNVTIQLAGQLF